jgi:hypothetical protein
MGSEEGTRLGRTCGSVSSGYGHHAKVLKKPRTRVASRSVHAQRVCARSCPDIAIRVVVRGKQVYGGGWTVADLPTQPVPDFADRLASAKWFPTLGIRVHGHTPRGTHSKREAGDAVHLRSIR